MSKKPVPCFLFSILTSTKRPRITPMSMIGNLLRVSNSELDRYLEDSSLLEDRIYSDGTETEDPNLTYIDKTWDGIIFLLTGDATSETSDHPLAKVLFSGQMIDEEQDMGYGPAHYLTSNQVADLYDQISRITEEELKQKFDPVRMNERDVYPEIWEEGETAFDYILWGFTTLKNTFAEAIKNKEAIITFIN